MVRAAALISLFMFAGCARPSDQDAALREEVGALKARVADLENSRSDLAVEKVRVLDGELYIKLDGRWYGPKRKMTPPDGK